MSSRALWRRLALYTSLVTGARRAMSPSVRYPALSRPCTPEFLCHENLRLSSQMRGHTAASPCHTAWILFALSLPPEPALAPCRILGPLQTFIRTKLSSESFSPRRHGLYSKLFRPSFIRAVLRCTSSCLLQQAQRGRCGIPASPPPCLATSTPCSRVANLFPCSTE
ncbi:hypothetical protein C8R43DRAFT_1001258 [Mycena crocata]|nr:hypothetical protein C8R43DRAFT_1001258 [Mycena crocata]